MRKNILITTVSAIVLMSAHGAFADTVVSNWEDLKNAVENTGGEIKLGADIEVPADGAITKYASGTVIDGQGYTIFASESPEGTTNANFRFINNSTTADVPLEIKNVNFKGLHYIAYSNAYGGAIYNYQQYRGTSEIGDIIGSTIDGKKIAFKDNYVKATGAGDYARAYGGAIYNYTEKSYATSKIGNITGDFINNYAESINQFATGGAIYNSSHSVIGDIYGSFEDNYTKGSPSFQGGVLGGAIYNAGKIGNENGGIWGDFINNYAKSIKNYDYSGVSGGAIYNTGTIGNKNGGIWGDFINNRVISINQWASGGAIRNSASGKIGSIYGNFINNYAENTVFYAQGGAIFNSVSNAQSNSIISSIHGSFINNHVQGNKASAFAGGDTGGGAIYNYAEKGTAEIGDITGSIIDGKQIAFKNNYAKTTGNNAYVYGGAIFNYGSQIGNIHGNFEGNYAKSEKSQAYGGAIYNRGTIRNITGDFINNYATGLYATFGGAIYNYYGTISDITGDFINNHAESITSYAQGGAIYNYSTIGEITGDFINNHAESTNSYAQGGAIYNIGTIGEITGDFINNHAESINSYAQGGAIYNTGTIGEIEGSFLNNHVKGNEESKGGAIYSNKDITIAAKDGRISKFEGNYVQINAKEATEDTPAVEEQKIPNAIYMTKTISLNRDQTLNDVPSEQIVNLNLNAQNGSRIEFNDEIDGSIVVNGYADEAATSRTELGTLNYNLNISGDDTGHVYFNNHIRNADITLDKTNLIVDNAIYLGNNDQMTVNSGNLTINSGHMMIKDLGLNQLHFNSLSIPNGLLTIASVDVDLANQTSGMISADNVIQTRAVGNGKIEVENIRVLSDGEEGDTQIKIVSDNIAKEVTTEIKEAVAPVYKYGVSYDAATGEFTFTRGDEVNPSQPEEPEVDWFNQGVFASDVFMMSSLNMQNSAVKEVASMDPNKEPCMGRVWALPFYSDDTIEYKNFYDVDSRNYGLIAGVDTRAFGNSDLSHVYTLFGAYSEGRDKYEGIKVENKSWLLGLKASMFSDNGLYGDAIVDIASHDMDADTFYGSDSHDTYGYGAALKGGYKHDIEKVNIDTSVMLSWQQIKGDDFTAKSGAKMKTDDYSRLSLMPQVKVGYDLNKVRPYALVRYNFVLDEDGSSVANDTTLPEIESKDYVEYGLGVETTTNSNHSGFAHVLRHDSGREGWSITVGYRYNF